MKYSRNNYNQENKISASLFQESLLTINEINTLSYRFKDNINLDIKKDFINFYKKYSNKINLKRFSIGIFGLISSGKSTFWNYILGLKDFLEVKSDIATKFICFIRHKKENEKAEVTKQFHKIEKLLMMKMDFLILKKEKKLKEM